MHSTFLRFLSLVLMAALCAACSDDPGAVSETAAAPATAPKTASTGADADRNLTEDAEKLTADMVRGVSAGKPTAPVDLKFSIAAKPGMGTPLGIDLAVITSSPSDSVTISVQASQGLDVDSGTSLASFPKATTATLYRHKLTVTPRAEGAFYVNVLVTMVVPGSGPQSRSFSIPLLVGGVAALEKQAMTPTTTDSSGERVSSAPAVETTH